MIEVLVSTMRQESVQLALHKIKACTNFDPGYGYQIGCVIKELETEFNKYETEAHKKYAELAEKDEKGQPKFEEKDYKGMKYQTFVFSEDNKKIADEVAITSGQNKIVLAGRPKLYLSKLVGAKLNPVELVSIDFMIDSEK